ncbi:MAG TPA: MFS transporter, partial [Bacteroidia bacterium]|nr:MFS transporter [Bacteroidia bacterium]
FSPAKFGILKEIVGSKRLGAANGLMQMLTMAGILAGMVLAGWWFDEELARRNGALGVSTENAWGAAMHLFVWGTAATALPVLLGLLIRRTPDHPGKVFRSSILGSHFVDLKYLLGQPVLRKTVLFIAAYWFVANFLGLAFFGFAKELHPDAAEGGVGKSASEMLMTIGVGLIFGSLFVSFLSRRGNRLSLAVFGGLVMAGGLLAIGLLRPDSPLWLGAVAGIGFASGFFLVPLSAHLQDRIDPEHRGRVLSAQNLIISFSGILAILANAGMKVAGMNMSAQTLVLVPGMIAVTLLLHRLLRKSALFPPVPAE